MYLSDPNNTKQALEITGLSLDELEYVVGRFSATHHAWPNELKGLLKVLRCGKIVIYHHFTRKKLWEKEYD